MEKRMPRRRLEGLVSDLIQTHAHETRLRIASDLVRPLTDRGTSGVEIRHAAQRRNTADHNLYAEIEKLMQEEYSNGYEQGKKDATMEGRGEIHIEGTPSEVTNQLADRLHTALEVLTGKPIKPFHEFCRVTPVAVADATAHGNVWWVWAGPSSSIPPGWILVTEFEARLPHHEKERKT